MKAVTVQRKEVQPRGFGILDMEVTTGSTLFWASVLPGKTSAFPQNSSSTHIPGGTQGLH